jgi:8-oxo-dGTP diphosphatase
VVSVVAGWLENAAGALLLTQRPADKSHPGCFEFPGGKVQSGESDERALQREFMEELGLEIAVHECLGSYAKQAQEQAITMRIYRVTAPAHALSALGAVGRERQAIRFVAKGRLQRLPLPPLDRPAVRAHALNRTLVISPEPLDAKLWLQQLRMTAQAGAKLVLLRAKHTPLSALRGLIAQARDVMAAHGAELLLQDDAPLVKRWRVGGMSLTSRALMRAKRRALPENYWLSASCHNAEELAQAQAIGCDFVTLAPVLATATHPDQAGMGWQQLQALCQQFPELPIYALGGMQAGDLATAQRHGAFGVAGIRGFWRSARTEIPAGDGNA